MATERSDTQSLMRRLMNKIRKSVMGVLCFEEEYLFIKRQNYLDVFPGYTSFPGGKVESSDTCELPEMLRSFPSELIACLQRELKEEISFDLFECIRRSEVLEFIELGKVITPDFNPARFENFYYKITLKKKPKINFDINEIKDVSWQTGRGIKTLFESNDILVVPPMLKLIEGLSKKSKYPLKLDLDYDSNQEVPVINPVSSVIQMLPMSNTFPPARRTNCFVIGDSDSSVFCIDPSPRDESEYNKLKNTLTKFNVNKIFITHHHPDHHEFVDQLARDLCLPIGISRDSFERIVANFGTNYFHNIEVNFYQNGDILTKSNGEDVVIYSTPGHDEGQLSLIPRSKKWGILSDLFQSIGTVVIQPPEGDMAKYFKSLEMVINLAPQVIFPSHGIALGGVDKLVSTLSHRKMREKQVLELYNENKTEHEMLDVIYQELDPRLHSYAMKTIHAHLFKLRKEGKIS